MAGKKDSTDSAYINAACMRDPRTARSADILRLRRCGRSMVQWGLIDVLCKVPLVKRK